MLGLPDEVLVVKETEEPNHNLEGSLGRWKVMRTRLKTRLYRFRRHVAVLEPFGSFLTRSAIEGGLGRR